MKIYDSLDINILNDFINDYFDLQRTYSINDKVKMDFYTIQSYLKNYSFLVKNLKNIKDSGNKYGAELLSNNMIFIDLIKNYKLSEYEDKSNIIEVKLERSNQTINLESGSFNLSKIPYIGESQILETANNIANFGLSNLKLINSKLPNGLVFDVMDNKGNAVKISDVKIKDKSIIEKYNPLSLETKGILPLKITELDNIDIEIESVNPVKIQNMQLANIVYDNIASSEDRLVATEYPIKKINILGVEEEYQKVFKNNFDLETIIKIDNQTYKIKNKYQINFGIGISSSEIEYLSLSSSIKEFYISFKIYKKDNITSESLIDYNQLNYSELSVTREQLSEGLEITNLLGSPKLYKVFDLPIKEQNALSLGTGTEIDISTSFDYYKNNFIIKDKVKTYFLGTSITDNTFIVENGILYIDSTYYKVGWLSNNLYYENHNGKVLVRSDLEINKPFMNNNQKLRKLSKTYYYKDFIKYDKNTIKLPAEVNSEDVRVIINETGFSYLTESTDTVIAETFKKHDGEYEVYISDNLQPFAKVVIFGEELRWNKVQGTQWNGNWLFDIPFNSTNTTITNNTIIPNCIKGSLHIEGYKEITQDNIDLISNLTLARSSTSSGSSVFDIPFYPYLNLSVNGTHNYHVDNNTIYVDSTDTSLNIDYLLAENLGTNSAFKVDGNFVYFYGGDSTQIKDVYYSYVDGYLDYQVLQPLTYNINNNKIQSPNLGEGKYLIKYSEGNKEDIAISHPRKILFEVSDQYE